MWDFFGRAQYKNYYYRDFFASRTISVRHLSTRWENEDRKKSSHASPVSWSRDSGFGKRNAKSAGARTRPVNKQAGYWRKLAYTLFSFPRTFHAPPSLPFPTWEPLNYGRNITEAALLLFSHLRKKKPLLAIGWKSDGRGGGYYLRRTFLEN